MGEHKSFSKKVTLTFSTFFFLFFFLFLRMVFFLFFCLLFERYFFLLWIFCQASIRNGLWLARCDASDGISDGVLRTPNDNVCFFFFLRGSVTGSYGGLFLYQIVLSQQGYWCNRNRACICLSASMPLKKMKCVIIWSLNRRNFVLICKQNLIW